MEEFNIELIISKLKEKRKCKYTEEGNYEEDEEELNIFKAVNTFKSQ